MNAAVEMPAPLLFTDAAAMKVKSLIDEEGNPDAEAAGICPGRRLFRFSVWLHLRRGHQRR